MENKQPMIDVLTPRVPGPRSPEPTTVDFVRRNAEKMVATYRKVSASAIPDCPECGAVFIDDPVLGPEGQQIRVLCHHQQADLDARDRRIQRENRYTALISKYGKAFPSRVHAGVRMGSVDDRKAKAKGKAAARRYLATWEERQEAGDGMMFIGESGTGKSYLGSAIAGELEARRHFTTFVVVADLPATLLDRDRGPLFMEMVAASDLVVIDDLATDNPTEYVVTSLFRLIDLCYREKKPLITTSNYGFEDLGAHYTRGLQARGVPDFEASVKIERIVSRLQEMTVPFYFVGEDQRAEKRHGWTEDLDQ